MIKSCIKLDNVDHTSVNFDGCKRFNMPLTGNSWQDICQDKTEISLYKDNTGDSIYYP